MLIVFSCNSSFNLFLFFFVIFSVEIILFQKEGHKIETKKFRCIRHTLILFLLPKKLLSFFFFFFLNSEHN